MKPKKFQRVGADKQATAELKMNMMYFTVTVGAEGEAEFIIDILNQVHLIIKLISKLNTVHKLHPT